MAQIRGKPPMMPRSHVTSLRIEPSQPFARGLILSVVSHLSHARHSPYPYSALTPAPPNTPARRHAAVLPKLSNGLASAVPLPLLSPLLACADPETFTAVVRRPMRGLDRA
jgi:hypothetical protein